MTDQQAGSDWAVLNKTEPRRAVAIAWANFQQIAAEASRPELVADLKPTLERFQLGLFRLVVMGEIKKGKSSFVNALLGEDGLLPTESDVATSTVYKVLYGPTKRFKVFFQSDIDTGKRREPLEIQEAELRSYGTEAGNPQNRQRVDFIGVELPNAMLKEGLVLVDTPGVGGLFKAHRDITWRYAPNADAVFFVLDSVEAVISRDEIEFLRELTSKVTKRVFFVQTKIDAPDTDQWRAWEVRNRELLTKELGIPPERLYYFPVSSKLKAIADKRHASQHLAESGFLGVIDFLQRGLLATKERAMARDVVRCLNRSCLDLQRSLVEEIRICQQQTREALDRLGQEYRQAGSDLERWEKTTYRHEMQTFGDRFSEYRQRALARIQQELDPVGGMSREIIDSVRSDQLDARQLNDTAGQLQQACLAKAAELYVRIQTEFSERVKNLILDVSQTLARTVVTVNLEQLPATSDGPPIRVEDSLNMLFSTFDDVRTSLYGGMAGAMIANIGVGLLAVVFPPAAAVSVFVALIGGSIGGWQAAELAKARKREEALSKLQMILQNLLRHAQQQATNHFNQSGAAFERRARDVFEKAAERARSDLAKRFEEIDRARCSSREEAQEKAGKLDGILKRLNELRGSLGAILEDVEGPSRKVSSRSSKNLGSIQAT
jgi:signal recognition particle receptor subunit beta